MTHAERLAMFAGKAMAFGCLGAIGLAMATPARADDDDEKYKTRRPAVVHPIVRYKELAPGGAGPDASFPAQNVELLTWIPLNNFPSWPGSGSGADCWGYVSPSGREYALIGLSWGNGIVEITNPANPQIITTIPGGVNVLWRDITVIGDRAYAVSDSAGVGIQVMNLQNIDAGQVTFVGNISQGGHSTTHTLLENTASGFLYACGGNATANGGCQPVSTANPNSPAFSGPGWTTSYVHEAQILTYSSGPYAGKEIAFLFIGGGGIAIVDVTNKAAPVTLNTGVFAYPGSNYSHQGWLSPDKKYLYHDDEIDGPGTGVPRFLTRVFDVSNLANPRLCATFTNGLPSVDHNQYVNGNYLYQSNYTTGFRLWDVSQSLRPVEVGYLDTRPEDNGTGYNGCWGNYAFFPSGTVIASDLERGLFIMKVSLLKLNPSATPSTLAPGQATPVTVQVNARDAQINSGAVKMHVSVNGGAFTPIAMNSVGGGAFAADIPAQSCNARVRYYFTADTDEAVPRTFTAPLVAPGEFYSATAQSGQATIFADDFQTDKGWTVSNTSVTGGAWARAIPAANGGHGAAIGDADGSGMAYVTGNGANDDVDGGPTRLLSPVFDLSGAPEAYINYSRWVLSIRGTNDPLVVELSNNNGSTWTQVESLGPSSGAWAAKSIRVADYVTPTAQVRMRLSMTDTGNDSQSEAGLDAFSITAPTCPAACYADCNTDGSLTVADFGCFQTRFAAADPYTDCNGDSQLTVADFGCFQTKFVQGCP